MADKGEIARIPLDARTAVSASLHGAGATVMALGHGAGGDRRSPFLVRFAEELAAAGRRVLLFNFPYSEARRRAPDRTDVLLATVQAVAGFARALPGARQLVLGGKSMGGRMCSMAAAQGLAADGLLFLGYPLHAPGKPEALRDAHLYGLQAPLLFVQGTRDAFARWDLLTPVLERLASRATLHAIDEGDHSFKAPKRAGLSPAQIEAGLVAAAVRWLDAHGL